MVPSRDSSSEEEAAIRRPGTKRQRTRESTKNYLAPLEVCLGTFPISTHQPGTNWGKKELALPFHLPPLLKCFYLQTQCLTLAGPPLLTSATQCLERVSMCVFKPCSHTRKPYCQTWYGPGGCVNRVARNQGSRLLGFESSVCYLQTMYFWQLIQSFWSLVFLSVIWEFDSYPIGF